MGALALLCTRVQAQSPGRAPSVVDEYTIKQWNTETGLPQSSATAMAQASDGALWFGTFSGLVRFDGARFAVHGPQTLPGLPSSEILGLYRDRAHRLWISTSGGLAVMENGRVRGYPLSEGYPVGLTLSMVEDALGRILVSGHGRALYRLQGERFEALPTPGAPSDEAHDEVYLATAPTGEVIAERGRSVFVLRGDRWKVLAQLPSPVLALGARSEGGVWLSTFDRIYALTLDGVLTPIFERSNVPEFDYGGIFETSNGDVWSTSFVDGARRYRPNNTELHLTLDRGLPHRSVRFVFEDDEHDLWIGTDGGGLVRLQTMAFKSYGRAAGLDEPIVRAVVQEAPGRLLVATHGGGVIRFSNGRFETLERTRPTPLIPEAPKWAWAMMKAQSGEFFVGYFGSGASVLTERGPAALTFERVKKVTVRNFLQTTDGTIWIASEQGLYRTEGQAQKQRSTTLVDERQGLNAKKSLDLALDPTGALYVATEDNGVFRRPPKGRFSKIALPEQSGNATTLFSAFGSVWGATDKGMLVRIGPQSVVALGAEQGVPKVRYRDGLEDARGRLWLATHRGALRIEAQDLLRAASNPKLRISPVRFGREDGLPSEDVNAIDQTDLGVVISTHEGFAVSTQRPPPRPVPREVQIAALSYVDLAAARSTGVSERHEVDIGRQLALPSSAGDLEIRLDAPALARPNALQIAFSLEGPQGRLQRRAPDRTLYFPALAPGDYQLRVWTEGRYASPKFSTLRFRLVPKLWQRSWFWPLLLIFAIVGVAGRLWGRAAKRARYAERALAQQKRVAQSEQRYREVIDTSQSMVWTLGAAGQFEFVSGVVQQIYGLGARDLLGRPFMERAVDPRPDIDFLRRLAGTPGSAALRTVHRRKDGAEVHLRFVGVARRDESGMVIGYAGTAADITEEIQALRAQQSAELQLERSKRVESLGLLAGGVAHDFSNVLAALISGVEELKSRIDQEAPERGPLSEIELSARSASALCERMLDYSGRGRFVVEPHNLNDRIEAQLDKLQAGLPSGVRLKTQLERPLTVTLVDTTQVQRALAALVSNAAQAYGPEGGEVQIRTAARALSDRALSHADVQETQGAGNFVCLEVIDEGAGMTAAVQSKMFDPFFSTKAQGRGLGLPVVQGIMRGHRGAVFIQSTPKKGTRVTLAFQASKHIATPARTSTIDLETDPSTQKTVLVIDDERPVRSALRRVLVRAGYGVLEADGGAAGLRMVEDSQELISAVLVDLTMPKMGGEEVYRTLKKRSPQLPVILMSGFDRSEAVPRLSEEGTVHFLQKPFSRASVVELLETAMTAEHVE